MLHDDFIDQRDCASIDNRLEGETMQHLSTLTLQNDAREFRCEIRRLNNVLNAFHGDAREYVRLRNVLQTMQRDYNNVVGELNKRCACVA